MSRCWDYIGNALSDDLEVMSLCEPLGLTYLHVRRYRILLHRWRNAMYIRYSAFICSNMQFRKANSAVEKSHSASRN